MSETTFGPAYEDQDKKRIQRQMGDVLLLVLDGQWRSLTRIQEYVYHLTGRHHPETSISAQLRHLRKARFGSYIVEKRRREYGLWEYRVLPPKPRDAVQENLFDTEDRIQTEQDLYDSWDDRNHTVIRNWNLGDRD